MTGSIDKTRSEAMHKVWEGREPHIAIQFKDDFRYSQLSLPYNGAGKLDEQVAAAVKALPNLELLSYRVVWKGPVPGTDQYPRSPSTRPYEVDDETLANFLAKSKEWCRGGLGVVIYRNNVLDSSTLGLVLIRPAIAADADNKLTFQPHTITKMASQVFCAEDFIKPEEDPTLFFKAYEEKTT